MTKTEIAWAAWCRSKPLIGWELIALEFGKYSIKIVFTFLRSYVKLEKKIIRNGGWSFSFEISGEIYGRYAIVCHVLCKI